MNKRRFQIISLSLTGILLILAGLQIFWLKKMYDSRSGEFLQKIQAAAEQAAYQYVTRIQKTQPTLTGKITLDSMKASDIKSITIIDSTSNNTIHVADHPDGKEKTYSYSYNISRNPNLHDIKITKITFNFLKDTESINSYRLLLKEALAERNLFQPHGIRFRKGEKDTVIGNTIPNLVSIRLPISTLLKKELFLEIENPYRELLKEMSGIILSSAFILLVLIFSFYYLLRTIFRQKTLEELKSDFTRNITHELKTPLSVASAANEALLKYSAWEEPEKRIRYLEATREQLRILTGMVERILSTTRQEQDDYQLTVSPHNLTEILQELIRNYTLQYEGNPQKRPAFKLNIPENRMVRIDRFHFTNVLNNLIDNAIKYSGENPEIEISVYSSGSGLNQNPASGSGVCSSAEIWISDNGPGIPPAAAKRIFDKFYRIPTGNLHNVKGFGLGLYYSKLIMEKHGGSISVQSKPGEGSTFLLTLPQS